jgi:hypothetical protein
VYHLDIGQFVGEPVRHLKVSSVLALSANVIRVEYGT